jgi:hypothetical protein
MRQFTDFRQRLTLIARQVSWSPDGKFIYAARRDRRGRRVLDGLLHES